MGKKDDAMYDYLEDPNKFADLVNVVLHQGMQVVEGSMLKPDDIRYVKRSDMKKERQKSGNRYRDLKKRLINGGWVAVAAIENQDAVDYAMPMRIMEYDCLEYQKQVKQIRRKKAQNRMEQGEAPNDWNTRLEKWDKLVPVYTICLYHGAEEWTGPESLKDMMDFKDVPPGWEEQFHDYGMTLYCANRVQDFTVFKTELGLLLQAISCKNDKGKLKKLLQDENYSHLERETAEAIAIMTDNDSLLEKLDDYENEGGYNMCKGLDDWAKEEQEKGEVRGKIEGKIEMLIQNIKSIMNNKKLTAEEAMEMLDVPEEEWGEYLSKL